VLGTASGSVDVSGAANGNVRSGVTGDAAGTADVSGFAKLWIDPPPAGSGSRMVSSFVMDFAA
jgi:hypothetical protein